MVPLFVLVVLIQVTCSLSSRNYGHERVVANLIDNYGQAQRLVRPSANTSVEIGLVLHDVLSFCDKTGLLKGGFWLKLSWVDERLAWEDESVAHVRVPIGMLWQPDIRIWNGVNYDDKINTNALPLVYGTGMVLWIPPVEFTTRCEKPTDPESNEWTCTLKLGSWTQNSWEVGLSFMKNATKMEMDVYNEELNGWKVEAEEGSMDEKYYDCCPAPYTSAKYVFKISKIPGGIADVNGAMSTSISLVTILFFSVLSLVSRLYM